MGIELEHADRIGRRLHLPKEQAMEWQDIATAPIDQGALLLSDGEDVTVGWWDEIPAEPGEHGAIEGWAHGGGVSFTFTPKFWAPLPEPPK